MKKLKTRKEHPITTELATMVARIDERIAAMGADVTEIKGQTKRTNGRLSDLEREAARQEGKIEGAMGAARWMWLILSGLMATGIGVAGVVVVLVARGG